MKTIQSLLTIAVLALAQAGLAASLIDFDDLGDNGFFAYAPSNHYQSVGAIFSRDILYGDMAGAGWPADFWPTHGGTSPNFLQLTLAYDPRLDIDIYFVVPGTAIPATTDMFRAQFGDANVGTSIGGIDAYDANGNLLLSQTQTTPPEQTWVFDIHTNGIARVRLWEDSDGGVVDNISFNTPTSSVGTNVTLAPVLSIQPAVQITWDSQADKLYQVQWSPALDTNWNNVGTPILGVSGPASFCDTTPGNTRRFYRVIVLP